MINYYHTEILQIFKSTKYSNEEKINKLYTYDNNVVCTIPNIEELIQYFMKNKFTNYELIGLMCAIHNNVGSICFLYNQTINHNTPILITDYLLQKYNETNNKNYKFALNACETVGLLYQKNINVDDAINVIKQYDLDESIIMKGKYKDYSFEDDSETEDEEYTYENFLESLNH